MGDDKRRKSGRMRVESFPLAHTTNRRLAEKVCEKYNAFRRESKLCFYLVSALWEVRLEMVPGREKAFTMDEVNWAQGFVTGFEANWHG